jgi:hypothetical protein
MTWVTPYTHVVFYEAKKNIRHWFGVGYEVEYNEGGERGTCMLIFGGDGKMSNHKYYAIVLPHCAVADRKSFNIVRIGLDCKYVKSTGNKASTGYINYASSKFMPVDNIRNLIETHDSFSHRYANFSKTSTRMTDMTDMQRESRDKSLAQARDIALAQAQARTLQDQLSSTQRECSKWKRKYTQLKEESRLKIQKIGAQLKKEQNQWSKKEAELQKKWKLTRGSNSAPSQTRTSRSPKQAKETSPDWKEVSTQMERMCKSQAENMVQSCSGVSSKTRRLIFVIKSIGHSSRDYAHSHR